ncbi:hypothetical protein C1I98_06310 [Spongiactinospora gelatinilytica]|uniref:Uncharacterized protein n=2 Tax=Spongiactinospora gelatinilytica TaxID=2666298 RepID=A0A2W2HR59_9ACTN|nr:hypothetical protein C1I98_06310 [Spongiactinospora gelatinilytica]
MKRKRTLSDRTKAVHHTPATSHPGTSEHLNANKRLRPAGDFVPRVTAREGTITHMMFSRTPSPFGKEMGDHTTAWASVVDALHASLHGKTVKDSVEKLRERQRHAEAWKSDDNSTGKKLWEILHPSSASPSHDLRRREDLLDESSRKVGQLLDQAEHALNNSEPPDKAAELLADAIDQHLTYDNALPYATVLAKSQTGSKGSGEGTARTAILEVERNPDAPLSDTEIRETRDNLWKLFSMEAAVREAGVEHVVAPEQTERFVADIGKAKKLSKDVSAFIDKLLDPNGGRDERLAFIAKADSITEEAGDLAARDPGYQEFHDMTAEIIQTVRALQGLAATGKAMKPKPLNEYKEALDGRSGALDDLKKSLDVTPEQAREKSALILAHLLYRHQMTVATAYPNAVAKSNFLTTDAAEAAAIRLREYLSPDKGEEDEDKQDKEEEDPIDQLVNRVKALHASFQPRPEVGDDSGWAATAGTRQPG